MVIAQRLVRKLCPQCKEVIRLEKSVVQDYKLDDARIYGPKGCSFCNKRGYAGRLPLFEIMSVDEELQDMIERRKDIGAIREHLNTKGMRTLREDGLDKVCQGLTSLDEVLSVTMESTE